VEPTPYVIQTQGLSKSYKEVQALKSLDLNVPQNSIFGFLGPNGAGKTTTMKILLGLSRANQGSGTIFGLDIARDSVNIRSRVGYLPQEPRFFEHMTARETLDFTARFFFKGPAEQIEKRVDETLELVDLVDKADRPVGGFSGGERQRLGIAQAQVNYPDLLILDEPAASLDPLGRNDVHTIMRRLKKYATIFYSTHILDDVQQVSDTVAILNHGELVTHGPIDTLLAGSEGIIYTIKLRGDHLRAKTILEDQTWTSSVNLSSDDDSSTFLVSVVDEQAADENLLRVLLADTGITITEYGRKKYELEEVFINLVGGGSHVQE
jgi:ABC-2 type transport system ATP-binding protein